MKKILIINGHPVEKSINYGISEAYKAGALKANNEVQEVLIGSLDFNPNLKIWLSKENRTRA